MGVGGLALSGTDVAHWSSRGMTMWEQPHGVGRMGVDVVTHGEFWGAAPGGGCQHQWGTSVACPVIVGVLALLLSALPASQRARLRSPAAVKQVLALGASRLPGASVFEQGMGALNVDATAAAMRTFVPHVSVMPPALNLSDCPYAWPYCEQPLHHGALPLGLNLTVLNSRCPYGHLTEPPRWVASSYQQDQTSRARHGDSNARDFLIVEFATSEELAPWSGCAYALPPPRRCSASPLPPNRLTRPPSRRRSFVGVRLSVAEAAAAWQGEVRGTVELHVANGRRNGVLPSAGASGECGKGVEIVRVPLSVRVVSAPPRHKRLLFDVYHSSAYPNGFFPNDDIEQQT